MPGTSRMAGRPCSAGWPRRADSPSDPIVPSPMFSWRSLLAPKATLESFRCRHRRRSSPTVPSIRSIRSSASAVVAKGMPDAHRCWVSRHTPSRPSPPAASTTRASSSNERPTVSPAPAAFSNRIGHGSPEASTASRALTNASTTPGSAVSNPLPRWLPMCRTSPSAPMPSAVARLATRHALDLSASAGSGEARLIR